MKTDKSGRILLVVEEKMLSLSKIKSWLVNKAGWNCVRENEFSGCRLNGCGHYCSFPGDGKFDWIRGEVNDRGMVRGVKEHWYKDAYYYEAYYTAGPKDLEWFAEGDAKYLRSLESEGNLRNIEPAVWYLWESGGRNPINVGMFWKDLLKKCHYFESEGTGEIDRALAKAATDAEVDGVRLLERKAKQQAAEEAKAKEDRLEKERQAKLEAEQKEQLVIKKREARLAYDRGAKLRMSGRVKEALVAFDTVLMINPNYPEAHCWRGNILRDLGRKEEALAAYDDASRVDPNYSGAHYLRGLILKDLGRKEEALLAFKQTLAINTGSAKAKQELQQLELQVPKEAFERGMVLQKLGRNREALAAFDTVLMINPNYPTAHCWRGAVLRGLGRKKEALVACDEALRVDPNDSGVYYWQGLILKDLGRKQEALLAFKQALTISPNYAKAQQELQQLSSQPIEPHSEPEEETERAPTPQLEEEEVESDPGELKKAEDAPQQQRTIIARSQRFFQPPLCEETIKTEEDEPQQQEQSACITEARIAQLELQVAQHGIIIQQHSEEIQKIFDMVHEALSQLTLKGEQFREFEREHREANTPKKKYEWVSKVWKIAKATGQAAAIGTSITATVAPAACSLM